MPDSISIATHVVNNIGTILLCPVLHAIATQQNSNSTGVDEEGW